MMPLPTGAARAPGPPQLGPPLEFEPEPRRRAQPQLQSQSQPQSQHMHGRDSWEEELGGACGGACDGDDNGNDSSLSQQLQRQRQQEQRQRTDADADKRKPGLAFPFSSSSSSSPSPSSSTNNTRHPSSPSSAALLARHIPVGVLSWQCRAASAAADDGDTACPRPWFCPSPCSCLCPCPYPEVAELERRGWIYTSALHRHGHTYGHTHTHMLRIYVLPDDEAGPGRVRHARSVRATLRRALRVVMTRVDGSPAAWEGKVEGDSGRSLRGGGGLPLNGSCGAPPDDGEQESLFYIFNTLEPPRPDPERVQEPFANKAMEEVLCKNEGASYDRLGVLGLRTPLFDYQRRSAAMMIQREAAPACSLDPRLQRLAGPTGVAYCYDREDGSLYRSGPLYPDVCGGVLAETMGCGKTLICLAVILATRGHFPAIPVVVDGVETEPAVLGQTTTTTTTTTTTKTTAPLLQMAASAAGRLSLPWRTYFEEYEAATGRHMGRCLDVCEANRGAYSFTLPARRNAAAERVIITLASGTLIIVPPNLLNHWLKEIRQHVQRGRLRVLVLANARQTTPPAATLLRYDVVLFTKPRFCREVGGPGAESSSSSSRTPRDSPLRQLHWLRVIIDEGNNFASHRVRTTALHILDQLLVERRWVVSGTPSTGLYGMELPLASSQDAAANGPPAGDGRAVSILRSRRTGVDPDEERGHLDRLRAIVDTLKLKPWSNSRAEAANWAKYMMPVGPDSVRRKSSSLRATLQSIMVRHPQAAIDVERPLPPLHNRAVELAPTWFDRLSLNLFVSLLAVNAVTSERADEDYMFHPRNRRHLAQLVANLRQAGFWWTGIKPPQVAELFDHIVHWRCAHYDAMPPADKGLVDGVIDTTKRALSSRGWNALTGFDELGVALADFPDFCRETWALDGGSGGGDGGPRGHRGGRLDADVTTFLGLSQARSAQSFVAGRLGQLDPAEGLSGLGIRTMAQMRQRLAGGEQLLNLNAQGAGAGDANSPLQAGTATAAYHLPDDSPLCRTRLMGTSSAKLTYLLDRVLELHTTEKILIFYDNNNAAFWIAEALDLVGVSFRIYSGTLKEETKNAYLALFIDSPAIRVLLMDLRQAAHGLHLACASRVFIVNPIWEPNVESQAIKRAHRIGQTRPVHVETLVLRGTLEDALLRRRHQVDGAADAAEVRAGEHDLLDDDRMAAVIKELKLLPLEEGGCGIVDRFAPLARPVGFFDRRAGRDPDGQLWGRERDKADGGEESDALSSSLSSSSSLLSSAFFSEMPTGKRKGAVSLSPIKKRRHSGNDSDTLRVTAGADNGGNELGPIADFAPSPADTAAGLADGLPVLESDLLPVNTNSATRQRRRMGGNGSLSRTSLATPGPATTVTNTISLSTTSIPATTDLSPADGDVDDDGLEQAFSSIPILESDLSPLQQSGVAAAAGGSGSRHRYLGLDPGRPGRPGRSGRPTQSPRRTTVVTVNGNGIVMEAPRQKAKRTKANGGGKGKGQGQAKRGSRAGNGVVVLQSDLDGEGGR